MRRATAVLTHDMLVEGVHFRADDPPADVAWKLVAVNLSDLAAKGAEPLGVLLGFTLGDDGWDEASSRAWRPRSALRPAAARRRHGRHAVSGAPRVLGLTAIGGRGGAVPSRAGGRPGDHLWVTGTIGDAGARPRALLQAASEAGRLVERYRNPRPRLEAGAGWRRW